MVSTQIIRCPICLLSQPIDRDVSPDKTLFCGNCKRKFAVKNGLPLNENDKISYTMQPAETAGSVATAPSVENVEEVVSRNFFLTWILGGFLWTAVIHFARPFMTTLSGPGFLAFYMMLLVGIWLGLSIARKLWEDSVAVTLIALLIFEGIGLVRYLDASAAGMHKFLFMFVMMGIGGVFLFARGDNTSSSSSSSSCSDCSSFSSCSGCGGGGGCGGCGD